MKQVSFSRIKSFLNPAIVAVIFSAASFFLFSFAIKKINDDLFKQLGISKTDADSKITQSILGGYLNAYGARNVKNIALGNRTALVKDLLNYTKKHVSSPAFIKEYAVLKENNKPVMNKVQTPEELRKDMVDNYKKSLVEMEKALKSADASMKPIFENAVTETKKQLEEAESPNNKMIATYTKNYPNLLKTNQQGYEQQLKDWETRYPANPLHYVKKQLQRFLDETADVDFEAELITKNQKKVFVNPQYERKGNYWKMAYRAGKEVVDPAREFVSAWIAEIN